MTKRSVLFLVTTLLIVTLIPLTFVYSQLHNVRTILNSVWDRSNHKLMTTANAGQAGSLQTEVTIFNDIWDSTNHYIRTSGGGGSGGGDFSTGLSSAVNSEFVLFSGTDGVTGKRATGTGLALSTSGVFSVIAPTDDNVAVGNGTTWELKALPNCTDTGGNHLNYTAATNSYSCGTSGSGGGAAQTPWAQDIDGGGFDLTNVGSIAVAGTGAGTLTFENATSGTIAIVPVTGALGTRTILLPANSGTVAITATSPITESAAGDIGCSTCVVSGGALGTPSSGVGTNLTGTAASLTAGLATNTVTKSGSTSTYVTTTGTQTSGDCVKIDASGNHIANGSACGSGGGGTVVFAPPGLRLTLETGVPVSTADQAAKGTLYYTPYISGMLIYVDGSDALQVATTAEISLSLTLTAATTYDVFVACSNSTTCTLSTTVWVNATTPSAKTTIKGATVLNADHTKVWIGSLYASATNLTDDSKAKRLLWNLFNKEMRPGYASATNAHAYATAAYREWNAGTDSNRVGIVQGIARNVPMTMNCIGYDSLSATMFVSIGIDSTTVAAFAIDCQFAGAFGVALASNSITDIFSPGIGYHQFIPLEYGTATGTTNFVSYGFRADVSN